MRIQSCQVLRAPFGAESVNEVQQPGRSTSEAACLQPSAGLHPPASGSPVRWSRETDLTLPHSPDQDVIELMEVKHESLAGTERNHPPLTWLYIRI